MIHLFFLLILSWVHGRVLQRLHSMCYHSKLSTGMDRRILWSSVKLWYCDMCSIGHVQLIATPCTVAHQAPLFMGFSRQECWSGLSFPSPGDLSHPGTELMSPLSHLTGNIYLVFVPSFWHQTFILNPWDFLSDQGERSSFCVTEWAPFNPSLF